MKPRYKIFLTCVLCFSLTQSFSQTTETTVKIQAMETAIKVQAMEMAKALIRNDFTRLAEYMPPSIIAYGGGREKLKSNFDSAASAMKQFGIEFKKIFIGNPGPIVPYHNQLQCVVPQTTTMQTAMGELEATTSLIAISMDNGKKWYFVDTNVYKTDKLKSILPDLSPSIIIPAQKPPKFTPKQ